VEKIKPLKTVGPASRVKEIEKKKKQLKGGGLGKGLMFPRGKKEKSSEGDSDGPQQKPKGGSPQDDAVPGKRFTVQRL